MTPNLAFNFLFHSFDHLFAQCPVNIESNTVIIDGMTNITGNTANINIIELIDNPITRGVILMVFSIRTNGASIKKGKIICTMNRSVTNHNPPAIISNSTADRYKTKIIDESVHNANVITVCVLGFTLVSDSKIFIIWINELFEVHKWF